MDAHTVRLDNLQHGCMFLFLLWPACLLADGYAMLPKDKSNIFLVNCKITNCRHEYHLQCILEWSQRSKECPICWQFLVLQDPTSQELLAAVEGERSPRSRNSSPTESTFLHHFQGDFGYDHDASYSDDSDLDEHIMQHVVAAASGAPYVHRRERQRSSGLGPSESLVFPPTDVPDVQTINTPSPEEYQNSGSVSSESNSPAHSDQSAINAQPLSSGVPSVVNMVSSTAANRDGLAKPRVIFDQPLPSSPRRPSPSDLLSFSDSIKSRLSAASARYKESISKGTRGFKEKLLSRNNSVKELSKGVQREMSAGIASVTRMIERLDPILKRTGASNPDSSFTGGTSNVSHKGKGVQENVITPSGNNGEISNDSSPDASPLASVTISDRVEVFPLQSGQ
ncbi:E3 ubiquitin-protein ligase RHF1A isoform X1 [Vitis vinifera]|uniref:E3 ubiquitin-protein ligase RHF1A isoform X1 n=1 Tax=Vitis vinifera TaxID=29760 RepID=UPI0028831E45|nr:E3 ubiquitin-protein ligase RHF1A isoform X1 [Vitis vinifera]